MTSLLTRSISQISRVPRLSRVILPQLRHKSISPSPKKPIAPPPTDLPNKFLHPIRYTKLKMAQIDTARDIYANCSKKWGDESVGTFFKSNCGLPDTFQSWFSVTSLHLWLYYIRMRGEGRLGRELFKEVADHFWTDTELQLTRAGVTSHLNKHMADLISSFYGTLLALDEGVYKGDAVLASAVWRNVFGCSQDVKAAEVLQAMEYVRRELQKMESVDRDVLLSGEDVFVR